MANQPNTAVPYLSDGRLDSLQDCLRKRRSSALRLLLSNREEAGGVLAQMTESGYTIGKALHGGSGGAALREVTKGGKRLVLKVAPSGEGATRLAAEYKILRLLSHPSIVEAYDWHASAQEAGFTMMLCCGKRLSWAVSQLCLQQSYCVGQKLVGAVQYLHANGIAHRDLHAGNVIVSPSQDGDTKMLQVFVIDFGSAASKPRAKEDHMLMTLYQQSGDVGPSTGQVSGSSAFAGEFTAPTILPPAIPSVSMGSAAKRDIFALGLLIASLLRREHTVTEDLFAGPQIADDWWRPQPVTKEVCRYVEQLLNTDPEQRVSADEAVRLLPLQEYWLGESHDLSQRSESRISL